MKLDGLARGVKGTVTACGAVSSVKRLFCKGCKHFARGNQVVLLRFLTQWSLCHCFEKQSLAPLNLFV